MDQHVAAPPPDWLAHEDRLAVSRRLAAEARTLAIQIDVLQDYLHDHPEAERDATERLLLTQQMMAMALYYQCLVQRRRRFNMSDDGHTTYERA